MRSARDPWTPLRLVLCFLLLPALVHAAPPEIAWRTHTGDRAEHGAVLLDGRLYVAGAAKVTDIDPASGIIRRFLLPPDPTEITSRPVATAAGIVAGDAAGRLLLWQEGTPATVFGALPRSQAVTALQGRGDRLFAGGEDGCVTALGPGASRAWSHCTAGVIGDGLAIAGDLVLAGDATGRVSVWSGARGTWRWVYDMDAPLAGAPVVTGDAVLLVGVDGHLYALDRERGLLRWRVHVGDRVRVAPAMGNGLVIVVTETRGLVAIDVGTGKVAWRASLPATPATPAVLGDLVVLGASDNALHAFDAASGKSRWRVTVPGAVLAPPLGCDAGILAVTEDGIVVLMK
ncbi:MAG: PQQ-binding-like beta-propeller repeat protein [Pseudomonadota bacterium]